MYRLIKFPGLKIIRPKMLTHHTSDCTLCEINIALNTNLKTGVAKSNVQCTRHHTTKTHTDITTNELLRKRRFRKNKNLFTELLEVYSNNTANQTKAPVRNLKPKDVSRIAIRPDLELDHFHQIKTKHKVQNTKPNSSKTTKTASKLSESVEDLTLDTSTTSFSECFDSGESNHFDQSKLEYCLAIEREITHSGKVINGKGEIVDNELEEVMKDEEVVPDVDDFNISTVTSSSNFQECIVDEYELQTEETENEIVLTNAVPQPALKKKRTVWKKETKEKLAKEKMTVLEQKCREKSFNTTLYAFLNLCVSCNFLQRGMGTLHHYIFRSKMSSKQPKITDIRSFEVLIRAYAANGNHNKVNELMNMVTSAGLKPSLNMIAAQLECAARSPKEQGSVRDIIQSLTDMGHELNDLFVKCTFLGNQRDIILKAIHEVDPCFRPVVPPPSICYSCALLQEINNLQGKNTDLRSPAEGNITKEQIKSFAEEQINNEFAFHLKVKSIEKRTEPAHILKENRLKLDSMRASWMQSLKNGFYRDVVILERTREKRTLSLLPYMKVLDLNSYVDIMMKEVQRLAEGSESFSPTTSQLYRHLGHQVKNRYIIKYKNTHGIADKTKLLYNKYCEWYLDPNINNARSSNSRQEWQQLLHENQDGPSIVGTEDIWPSTVLLGIGRFLYSIIVGDVNIDVNILNKIDKQHMLPAFYRVYRQQGIKAVEEIKPHPVISRLFRAAAEEHILFDISLVPMLSPPLPWTSPQAGGYLSAKTDIIRVPDYALQQKQRLKEAPVHQLFPPLDSLNQLGSIPWQVNKPVLDTVIEVFNNGGSEKLDIPEPVHSCPVAEPVGPSMNSQERYQAYRQRMNLRRQKAEMYSLWCDALYKLSLANHYRDRIFWLPHNMDFRGRVYPCPPHLNHLGADMPRSLLCFAQGKPLGPSGLDWLKIHVVNLLGTKKRDSVQDRLEYANSIMPDILDSAEKPLTGSKWWMDSETPWQTLACCKEILAAMQHPEGPEHFVSHFPIHQDGSCNGLQHYAALGRDEAGASSVNLMPQELPQDVYSCVAALVERERAKDSAAGVAVAKVLDGFVRRKVIKQTVMTTVYGVTRFGARLQIAKQLKDIDSFPKEFVWPASTYLVLKTFESLREMFNSTREIQDWFTECARLVSHICGQNMEYVTPLGLPVVQYYSRQLKKYNQQVSKLGSLQEFFPIDMFERPNVMKQKNAFPPNFIHSLDSSHMMLTSIFSEQSGITFVSVHDCFWTHASTVHIMNQICREQFVALHSQPILEDLSDFMLKKYGYNAREINDQTTTLNQAKHRLNTVLAQVPPKGTFVLENVLDSIYFFS